MPGCADVCLDHDYDSDENAFYSESLREARKTYTCCECGGVIAVGATYQCATGKSDGRIWTKRTCALCAEIRQAFVCGSWIFGELWNSIENGMFPIWNERGPIDCLAKLESIEARDMARSRYRIWQEDNGQ